ncbi:MAG: GtrA family protein [Thermoprotei archaeon]
MKELKAKLVLRDADFLRRLMLYSLVGASGVVVNEISFSILQKFSPLITASIIAVELSILWNFALNDAVTFRDRKSQPVHVRLAKFHGAALLGSVVQILTTGILIAYYKGEPLGLVQTFASVPGLSYATAAELNLPGILLGFVVRFTLSYSWVWRS